MLVIAASFVSGLYAAIGVVFRKKTMTLCRLLISYSNLPVTAWVCHNTVLAFVEGPTRLCTQTPERGEITLSKLHRIT